MKTGFFVLENYSVLSAMTGSFFDAIFAGTSPAITVRSTLKMMSIAAPSGGREAIEAIPVSEFSMIFMGSRISSVMPIPIAPEISPIMKVSALKTLETSFFDAPIERRIPISFVRSRTEIYVIIPIIIEETTSEIATKAIRT